MDLPVFGTRCRPIPDGSAGVCIGILPLYGSPVEPVGNLRPHLVAHPVATKDKEC